MAAAPEYEQHISTDQLPNVRANTEAPIEAFGGGAAGAAPFEAVERNMGMVHQIALEEKHKADTIATQDFYAKATQMQNDLFYNQDYGASSVHGEDVVKNKDYVKNYQDQLEEKLNDLQSGLTNRQQSEMAQRIRRHVADDFNNKLQHHYYQESVQYDKETTDSGLDAAKNNAVLNYQDEHTVEKSKNDAEAIVDTYAARHGMPEDWVTNKKREVESGINTGIVNRMLADGLDLKAKEFYDDNKDGFTAKDITHVEKSLEEGSVRGSSQRAANYLRDKFPGDLSAQTDAAKKMRDPKVVDETLNRLVHYNSLDDAASRQQHQQQYDKAANDVMQAKSLDAIPPSEMLNFSDSEQKELGRIANGFPVASDEGKVYALKLLAGRDPDRFLKTNLTSFIPYMSQADFNKMADMQTKMSQKDDNANSANKGFMTQDQMMNAVITQAGVDTANKSNKDKVMQLKLGINEAIQSAQSQPGASKTLTDPEKEDIARGYMTKVVVNRGSIFGASKVPFSEVQPGESFKINNVKDIPPQFKMQITNSLKSHNQPVTDQRIMDLYGKYLESLRSGR